MAMNIEKARLRTYDTWPENAPVRPRELAQNGFFATGRFLEAECYWCHNRISEWEYGDEIAYRHRLVNPNCEFLVDYSRCGNIPLPHCEVQPQMIAGNTYNVPDLMIESNRLATFKNWPNPNISPQSLAKAGFYYLNRSDEVKCVWCKGVIAKWEKHDNAFDEHQRFFPDCPRVQLGPLIEMTSDGIRDLGIQQISAPRKPKFSSLDARLRTYTNWPIPNIQRPEALAQAGLYYQDVDDQVRCFHCNMGLRSWEKDDDPWFEHAKWHPQCQFVRLVKGINYVQQVQEMTQRSVQGSLSIEEAMMTDPVRQALEIGIDGGIIRNITQRRLLTTGCPYLNVEDLLKAVFEDNEDESEGSTENGVAVFNSAAGRAPYHIKHETTEQLNTLPSLNRKDYTPSSINTEVSTHELYNEARLQPLTTSSVPNSAATTTKSNTTIFGRVVEQKGTAMRQELSPNRCLSLEDENRKLKDARLCKVCLDEEVGVVFLPCGHLVTCVQCAPGVNQCPMCRKAIKGFVRTYLS